MFSFTPTQVPATRATTESLEALLKLIADPKSAADTLAAMKACLGDIETRHADLDEKAKSFNGKVAAGNAALDARRDELRKREAAAEKLKSDCADADRRKSEAVNAENSLRRLQAEYTARERAMKERSAGLDNREREIGQREAQLDKRHLNLQESEADYNRRMASLKALAG